MNDLSFNRPATANGAYIEPGGAVPRRNAALATPAIMHFLKIAKRWKWLLIGSIAVALILGLGVTLLMTPKYTATSMIEIQRESARVVNVQGVEPEASPSDLEFYQTQYGLLKSQTLAERVATDLRFYDNADFFEMFGESETADEIRGGSAGRDTRLRNDRIRSAAKILLDHLTVDPQRLSRLVEVGFTSPEPNLSAQVVNTWTRLFIDMSLNRRFEATSYARNFLEERLDQLRQRLQESERALVGYAANQKIINIPEGGQGGTTIERSVVAENLAAANQELNEAMAARIAAESRLRGGGGGTTTEGLQNATLTELRSRRAQLASERARLLSQFQPDYPPAQALADQIREIDRAIGAEEGRVSSTLQRTYAAASAREGQLKRTVQGLEGEMLDLRRRTIQYNIYEREVDTNRQLYDALLQRYKEIGVAGGVGVNNISVVDPALIPQTASSPRLLINLLVAGLIGTVFGIALALLLDQADDAISDPREMEEKLALPLLGTIPKAHDEPNEDMEDPKSALVEAYLSVQARLAFTTEHGVPHSLAVTSTRPGEGKSTTAYALARTLARTARKVVIVDADMRSPSQHEFFGAENDRGLSNYLSGFDDVSALIRQQPDRGLALISAGPTPPNAAELLTSGRLAHLITELKTRYDHVIIDAPPVMGLADTPLIASQVEGTIFIIESHKTRASMAQVALGRLQSSSGHVIGGLLTLFDSRRADYGYGYEYGYGYGERKAEAA